MLLNENYRYNVSFCTIGYKISIGKSTHRSLLPADLRAKGYHSFDLQLF